MVQMCQTFSNPVFFYKNRPPAMLCHEQHHYKQNKIYVPIQLLLTMSNYNKNYIMWENTVYFTCYLHHMIQHLYWWKNKLQR